MSNNGWISLKAGKPPMFQDVLAYSKEGRIRITCVDASGKMDNYQLEDENDRWTHWTYIPEPPKTKKS